MELLGDDNEVRNTAQSAESSDARPKRNNFDSHARSHLESSSFRHAQVHHQTDMRRADGWYKQSEYGKVILPFTVLRRLDCVLELTKAAVLTELDSGP